MSEQPQETEVVSGVIGGITQKRADTWQVAVRPAGSQYDKNLWTKNADLVAKLSGEIGAMATFHCNVSYWTNQSQQQVRSLWIASTSQGGEAGATAVTPTSPAQGKPSEPEVDWDEKERRAIRSKAWAHAMSLWGPQRGLDGMPDDAGIPQMLSQMKLAVELIYADICRSHEFAHPNLGDSAEFGEPESVPFD